MSSDPDEVRAELEESARKSEEYWSNQLISSAHGLVQALYNRRNAGIDLRIERERLDFVIRNQAVWAPEANGGTLRYSNGSGSVRVAIAARSYERAIDEGMKAEADINLQNPSDGSK